MAHVMDSMDLASVFNVTLNVPNLDPPGVKAVLEAMQAVSTQEIDAAQTLLQEIPMKRLLLLVEMARQRSNLQVVPFDSLVECVQDLAL